MHKTAHWFQWVIVGLFGGYLLVQVVMAGWGESDRTFHYAEFGSVPVQENGRVKPFDTVARAHLMVINHRQTLKDDDGKTYPASKWILDNMLVTFMKGGGPALQQKIFRIENIEVLDLLHLEPRPGSFRYSLSEFNAKLDVLRDEVAKAQKVPQRDRTLFQSKVIDLWGHIGLFFDVARLHTPGIIPDPAQWVALAEAEEDAKVSGKLDPLAEHFVSMMILYGKGDVDKFNASVKQYREAFEKNLPGIADACQTEVYFNELAPFYHCCVLYTFVFVLACVSWMGWFPVLNRAAFWSMLLIVLMHTWALFARMYLQDRPFVFVTNLYSSAVFIGFGSVVTCLVFEFFFRNSIGLAVGSVTGALSLFIAHLLSLDSGDTMEQMRAVLDTNFWLATHVTCVTMGYTATFVAGFIGIAFVAAMAGSAGLGLLARVHPGVRQFLESPDSKQGARAVFTRFFDTDASSVLGKMLYGVVCFGMFLSFTGTVLGGLWADYSWGRFWGWDPKENGALLIVIWCALILHARWGGMVKQRGIAILAVLGNMVTAWSWFGTNALGVGLHSYGFMAGTNAAMLTFDCMMLAIAGIGLLPLEKWAKLPPKQAAASVALPRKPDKVPQTV